MPSGAIVRTPLRVRPASRRTFAQRVALRFPAVATVYTRVLARLKPGSRLRRELMRRFFQDGVEAFNRRDFDVLLLGVDPDREVYPPPEVVDAGFAAPRYHGRDGYYDWVQTWADVWGKDVRLEAPLELIDLGDRTVLLGEARAHGQGSGVDLSWEWAAVSTLSDGRPVRDDVFNDHAQALAAAGLSG